MKRSKSVHALCAVVLGLSIDCLLESKAVAVAPTVSYQFLGTVTQIFPSVSSTFHVGDLISGHASLTLAVSNPTEANYNLASFSATIGNSYSLTATAGGAIVALSSIVDSFDLDTNTSSGLHGSTINGLSPNDFSIVLTYNSLSDLTSTDLIPQFVFDTSSNQGFVVFNSIPSDQVYFKITDFSAVPEPTTLTLLALGTVGLAVMRRRP